MKTSEPISQDPKTQMQVLAIILAHGQKDQKTNLERTRKQRLRASRIERLVYVDLPQLKIHAADVGLPTRFLKTIDEMKIYLEQHP